jgi:hypothetical protein
LLTPLGEKVVFVEQDGRTDVKSITPVPGALAESRGGPGP